MGINYLLIPLQQIVMGCICNVGNKSSAGTVQGIGKMQLSIPCLPFLFVAGIEKQKFESGIQVVHNCPSFFSLV